MLLLVMILRIHGHKEQNNTWFVSSVPISDVDIWDGESITVDVSLLFSVTDCPSINWLVSQCDLYTLSDGSNIGSY